MTGTIRGRLRDACARALGMLMSLNDPQWGRRPGQGPPDLDELWRDFNRKLNGLFGRRVDRRRARQVGNGHGPLHR